MWRSTTRRRKLVAQFDGYCPFPDLCVNGKQVLTENIADLAGLLTAHDAYLLSLKGKPDVVIDGLTGEQRFFLAFARRWRKLQDEALRKQIETDTTRRENFAVIQCAMSMPGTKPSISRPPTSCI